MEDVYNRAIGNCKILNLCNNWDILQYLEVYFIKTKSPVIDVGLKVLKNFNCLND